MIFCHIIADFNLQGILASMKQKSWWEKQEEYSSLYKYDYIISLIIHSISWTFLIMLPLAIYYDFKISYLFIIQFILNVVLHVVIDNEKANRKTINLITDQILHLIQILITFKFIILERMIYL
jgi:hypothetical protein